MAGQARNSNFEIRRNAARAASKAGLSNKFEFSKLK
jgi:hypothetical protein